MAGVLTRLREELEIIAGVAQKKKGLEERDAEDAASSDLCDLFQQMEVALGKAAKKKRILIVIDGLGRLEELSRTSKVGVNRVKFCLISSRPRVMTLSNMTIPIHYRPPQWPSSKVSA